MPAAPIEKVAQVIASQQTEALGMLQKDPSLDLTLAGLPLEFDGVRPPYRFSAPQLGEHNDLLSAFDPQESHLMKDLKYQTLALVQPSEHLLVVRINRPEVRNAISTQVGLDMLDRVRALRRRRTTIAASS